MKAPIDDYACLNLDAPARPRRSGRGRRMAEVEAGRLILLIPSSVVARLTGVPEHG